MSREDTQFKPGQSGNPNGRPKTPADIVASRKFSREEFERALHKYGWKSLTEIKADAEKPDAPAIVVWIAKIITEGIKKGDERRLAFVLSYMGVSPANNEGDAFLALASSTRTPEEVEALKARARELAEKFLK